MQRRYLRTARCSAPLLQRTLRVPFQTRYARLQLRAVINGYTEERHHPRKWHHQDFDAAHWDGIKAVCEFGIGVNLFKDWRPISRRIVQPNRNGVGSVERPASGVPSQSLVVERYRATQARRRATKATSKLPAMSVRESNMYIDCLELRYAHRPSPADCGPERERGNMYRLAIQRFNTLFLGDFSQPE